MKNLNTLVVAILLVATPAQKSIAQITKIWQQKTDYSIYDAGQQIETYVDGITGETYLYTVTLINSTAAMIVSKRDAWGTIVWSYTIDNPDADNYWQPKELVVNSDGSIAVAGQVYNYPEAKYKLFVIKLSSSGTLEWGELYALGNTYYYYVGGFDIDEDEAYYYLASSYAEYSGTGTYNSVFEIIKMNVSDGSTAWIEHTEYENRYATMNAMLLEGNGIYVTGNISNEVTYGYDIHTVKYNVFGDLEWEATHYTSDTNTYSLGNDIAVNNEGNIVVSGYSDSRNLLLLAYNPDGSTAFEYERDFGANGYIYKVQVEDEDNSKTYIACQFYKNLNTYVYISQMNDFGGMEWETYLNDDYLTALKLSPDGESAWLLTSYYSAIIYNYLSRLSRVDEGGSIISKTFKKYDGYSGVMDFSTNDGVNIYLEGSTNGTSPYYTDELTARWEFIIDRQASDTAPSITKLYPNPCTDFIILQTGSETNTVSVFDVNGRLIAAYENLPDGAYIQTESWASGVYMVKIVSEGEEHEQKIVKE